MAGDTAFAFTALAFTLIALAAPLLGYGIYRTYKRTGNHPVKTMLAVPFLCLLSCLFCWMAVINYNMLFNYIYVTGETIETCTTTGKHPRKGVRYTFTYKGVRYTKCSAVGNYKVQVPALYKVRLTPFDPEQGIMDFERPM